MTFLALIASTFLIGWTEAESCETVCSASHEAGTSPMASGGKLTPFYWGETPGDRLLWKQDLRRDLRGPWLAVRYAFGERRFGAGRSTRNLTIRVGDRSLRLPVPDTGSWARFKVAWIELPSQKAGPLTIAIESPEAHTNTDIDCIGLFDEKPAEPEPPFVDSFVRESSDHRLIYCRSPKATVFDPAAVFSAFARIESEMDKYAGWSPPVPVEINIVEQGLWPNPHWSAYSNESGCFFRSQVMAQEQGNWCHELTHMMFQGRIPKWLDEPLVRVVTELIWVPRLYPQLSAGVEKMEEAAKDFKVSPAKSYDSLQPVLYAMAGRYGIEFFGRFFHACVEAGKKHEIELAPNRQLMTSEIVRMMSRAAGEDVAPMLRRWSGFAGLEGRTTSPALP